QPAEQHMHPVGAAAQPQPEEPRQGDGQTGPGEEMRADGTFSACLRLHLCHLIRKDQTAIILHGGSMTEQLWATWRLAYVATPRPPAGADPCFICEGLSADDDRRNLIALRTPL